MTQPILNKPVKKKARVPKQTPQKSSSYLSEHYSDDELALYRFFQGYGKIIQVTVMSNIPLKSSDIQEVYEDYEIYRMAFGRMCSEYSGIMIDLYSRSKNSEEVVLSAYENRVFLKILYLLNRRNLK